jgi:hypothetical protein
MCLLLGEGTRLSGQHIAKIASGNSGDFLPKNQKVQEALMTGSHFEEKAFRLALF